MTTKDEMNAKQAVAANTIRLYRVFKAPSDRVYKAILDPAAISKWLPPHGYTCTAHHLDAKVGGTYKLIFMNFFTGKLVSYGGKYVELKPGERIVATDKFYDPELPEEMRTTYTLTKVSVGAELIIVQENLPAVIPLDGCYLGWQQSLQQLANLVEPEIPDEG